MVDVASPPVAAPSDEQLPADVSRSTSSVVVEEARAAMTLHHETSAPGAGASDPGALDAPGVDDRDEATSRKRRVRRAAVAVGLLLAAALGVVALSGFIFTKETPTLHATTGGAATSAATGDTTAGGSTGAAEDETASRVVAPAPREPEGVAPVAHEGAALPSQGGAEASSARGAAPSPPAAQTERAPSGSSRSPRRPPSRRYEPLGI
ncbi:MAG: hypothetical protein KF894_14600 [Labilithrix sp.]|nr:hypothetical protein [Labilithrix sp.]